MARDLSLPRFYFIAAVARERGCRISSLAGSKLAPGSHPPEVEPIIRGLALVGICYFALVQAATAQAVITAANAGKLTSSAADNTGKPDRKITVWTVADK